MEQLRQGAVREHLICGLWSAIGPQPTKTALQSTLRVWHRLQLQTNCYQQDGLRRPAGGTLRDSLLDASIHVADG